MRGLSWVGSLFSGDVAGGCKLLRNRYESRDREWATYTCVLGFHVYGEQGYRVREPCQRGRRTRGGHQETGRCSPGGPSGSRSSLGKDCQERGQWVARAAQARRKRCSSGLWVEAGRRLG